MTGPSDDYWKQEFEKRVSAIKTEGPHAEHRATPRYRFEERTTVQVSGPPMPYRILNVSAGGVAILADHQLATGTHLMLSLKGSIFVEIVVVGSDLVEQDESTMDFAYNTRCKFLNEQDGFMAFVLLAEA